ncbi:MAG: DUF3618 domain-containing protein [Pyrinomonadaceae bacterium]|nr:DUF3618 domain-containing protein [Pyrinomonadaceae bacterium]
MGEKSGELDETTKNNLNAGNAIGAPSSHSISTLNERMSEDADFDKDADVVTDTTLIDTNQEPEQIKAQIAQTRNEMTETINAIQDKLSFSNISEQVQNQVSEQITGAVETAKTYVYDATIKKAQDFMNTVGQGFNDVSDKVGATLPDSEALRKAQKSPVALSIIGLSVGAIVFALTRKGSSKSENQRYQYDYDVNHYEEPDGFDDEPILQRITDDDFDYGVYVDDADFDNETTGLKIRNENEKSTIQRASQAVSDAATQTYTAAGNVAGKTVETVGNVAGKAVETVGNAANKAVETVSSVATQTAEGVTNLAGQAYQKVGNVGSTAKSFAGQTQNKYTQYQDESPLAFGAVALAIGAGIGFALPQTRRENELMGESRQRIIRQTQDAIYETVENAKTTLRDMSQNVKEQAGEAGENLQRSLLEVSEEIKVKAGETVQEVKDKIGDVGQNVKDKIEEVSQNVKDKVGEVSQNVKDKAAEVGETVQNKAVEVGDSVKNKTDELSQKAKEKTDNASQNV